MRDKLKAKLVEAMKAKDMALVGTLRMIQSALKDKDIEVRVDGRDQASAEEELAVLQKMAKQRRESLTIYEENGRQDLADKERAELDVIAAFLPQQLGESETLAAIDAAIASTGASAMADMGKVMAELKAKYAGQLDFGKVGPLVRSKLG